MGIMFTVFPYSVWQWTRNFKTAERFWRAFRQCHDLAERIVKSSPLNWTRESGSALQLQRDLEGLTYFRDETKRIKLCRIFLDKWEARVADGDLFETSKENQVK